MAIATSADGSVTFDSNTIGEVTSFSLERSTDTVETTTIGDTSRTYLPTLKSSTLSIDGFFDIDDVGQESINGLIDGVSGVGAGDVDNVGNTATFEVFPTGTTGLANSKFTGSGIVTSFTINSSVGEMISFSCSIQCTGDLTVTEAALS